MEYIEYFGLYQEYLKEVMLDLLRVTYFEYFGPCIGSTLGYVGSVESTLDYVGSALAYIASAEY